MNFSLSDEEQNRINAWIKEVNEKCLTLCIPIYTGAAGGRFTYSFTPTNIGTVIKVHDSVSGWSADFTDYDSW